MKLCKVTNDNFKAFSPFISPNASHIMKDRRSLSIGFFEDQSPLGAVVFFANNGILEVRSFDHLASIEDGECEKALAEFADKQQWPNIYRMEFIVAGTEDFLSEYDYTMLDIGFVPAEGDTRKFSSTLGDVYRSQKDSIELFKKNKKKHEFILGKNLTPHQVDSYNGLYPYNRYFPDIKNRELSCFMLKNNEPVAGILMEETSDGKLEFQWMSASGQSPQTIMKLIYFTLTNALSKYPEETEVIICPFTSEVKSLISKFGFSECPENIRTRIYSYYL